MMPWKRLEKRQIEFVDDRKRANVHMDDAEFLRQSSLEEDSTEWRIAAVLRELVARECGVDPRLLLPDDSTASLEAIMGATGLVGWLFGGRYGFEFHSVFYGLEGRLSKLFGYRVLLRENSVVELRMFARDEKGAPDPTQTLRDWIVPAAREISALLR